jgi:hypothetical protein
MLFNVVCTFVSYVLFVLRIRPASWNSDKKEQKLVLCYDDEWVVMRWSFFFKVDPSPSPQLSSHVVCCLMPLNNEYLIKWSGICVGRRLYDGRKEQLSKFPYRIYVYIHVCMYMDVRWKNASLIASAFATYLIFYHNGKNRFRGTTP